VQQLATLLWAEHWLRLRRLRSRTRCWTIGVVIGPKRYDAASQASRQLRTVSLTGWQLMMIMMVMMVMMVLRIIENCSWTLLGQRSQLSRFLPWSFSCVWAFPFLLFARVFMMFSNSINIILEEVLSCLQHDDVEQFVQTALQRQIDPVNFSFGLLQEHEQLAYQLSIGDLFNILWRFRLFLRFVRCSMLEASSGKFLAPAGSAGSSCSDALIGQLLYRPSILLQYSISASCWALAELLVQGGFRAVCGVLLLPKAS